MRLDVVPERHVRQMQPYVRHAVQVSLRKTVSIYELNHNQGKGNNHDLNYLQYLFIQSFFFYQTYTQKKIITKLYVQRLRIIVCKFRFYAEAPSRGRVESLFL